MEKVRLTVDELEIQSFTTTERPAGKRGTVRGHDAPTDEVECPTYDVNWNTCQASCQCSDSCYCETAACSVDDCWFTDWGPCTWNGTGNPSDC
ncbi:MAG TPA: hypothetical protein VFJ16_16050 [Longimicrobium sp.]|nr:hypothetical protein [Longimicrobium sp.]